MTQPEVPVVHSERGLLGQLAAFAIRRSVAFAVFCATLAMCAAAYVVAFGAFAYFDGLASVAPYRLGIALVAPIVVALPCAWLAVSLLRRVHLQGESLRALLEQEHQTGGRIMRLLSTVSHEVRTPLNGIVGMSRALLQEDLHAEPRQHAVALYEAARTLERLVDDILSLVRVDQDTWQLSPVPFRPQELASSVQRLVANLAAKTEVETRYLVDPSVPEAVVGDDARIRQVLVNLMTNALKFTEQGSVTLRIRPHIMGDNAVAKGAAEAPGLLFEVVDTGVGISPAELPRVFEEFAQAGRRDAREQGSGLGLSISSRLVAKMGGELAVASSVGVGSRFFFTLALPLAPPDAEFNRDLSVVSMPEIKDDLRVLLVEDNKTNRDVAVLMLRDLGIRPDVAVNGAEAVAAAQSTRYDIVLMDVRMPVMDGLTATRRIRALNDEGGPRVVMLTANALPDQHAAAYDAGADAIVDKPIRVQRLRDAMFPPEEHKGNDGTEDHREALARIYAVAGGDEELFHSLINDHVSNVSALLESIERGLEQEDLDTVCRAAHTLKSTASMFGSHDLAKSAAKLERAAIGGRIKTATDAHPQLAALGAEACKRLRAHVH